MRYLLIIKIKSGINKPERKGTFVLSKARLVLHVLLPHSMDVCLARIAEHHRVSLWMWSCWDQGWQGGAGGGGGGGGGGGVRGLGHAVARTRLSVG